VKNPLGIVAALALAVFVVLWGWIGFYVLQFEPSHGHKLPVIPVATAFLAALFAGGVATWSSTMIGIELRARLAETGNRLGEAVSSLSRPVWVGSLVYLATAVFVGGVWLTHQRRAPEIMAVFTLLTIGWLVGILIAALQTTNDHANTRGSNSRSNASENALR
jgi:hypothetical protein